MDALRMLLEELRQQRLDRGHTLGLFHLLIGRQIRKEDGTMVTRGLTWRQLAALLKKVHWDKDAVLDLGLEPDALPLRDRQQYWYAAISKAQVDGEEARLAGATLTALLQPLGYQVV